MHVYLREEPVELEMREVDAEGLVKEGDELVPVAFFVAGNETPSFRALLPPDTLALLSEATQQPVQVGLLAEEPEQGAEIQAMVGLSIPVERLPEAEDDDEDDDVPGREPWASNTEAWRGQDGGDDPDAPRTVLLAFAPLVRLARRRPDDFGEELADLLESALAGQTRPSLQARVDQMLGDI